MSLSRNLVHACSTQDFAKLYVGTKQIFGMCDRFGVVNTQQLFLAYCYLVSSVLKEMSVDEFVNHLTTIVYGPEQKDLARLLGYNHLKWSSMLTFKSV